MDKLKHVLKYQFWILLAVALILPLVGWMMATSGLVSEAATRSTELNSLNDKLTVTPEDPNKDWESGLEAINTEQSKQPQIAHKQLYERQLPLMTWPTQMPVDMTKFQNVHGEFYRTAYRQMVEEVRKIVKPYDEDSQTGLVIYPEDLLPSPDSEWAIQAPSVKQVEAAQEDLWLLASLLKQIASVNKDEDADARTPFEAAIRQINELYLRGGTKTSGGGGAKPAAGGAAGPGMKAPDSMTAGAGGGISGGSGLGGRSGGESTTGITSAKINPDDDLGPEQPAAAAKTAETPKSGSAGGMGMAPAAGGLLGGERKGSSAGTTARWSGSSMGRYREDKPEYKTRGFYLEVVMDHRRIPDLLAALVNADWPVNILRVQESDFKDEDLADASAGGLGGMGQRGGGAGAPPPGMGGGAVGRGAPAAGGLKGGPKRSDDESGESSGTSRSPFDDPNLSNVAIVGVIYIFNKPFEKPGTIAPVASPASSTPPAASPVASTPVNGAPGSTKGDPSKPAAETAADTAVNTEPADSAAATPKDKADDQPESDSDDKGKPAGKPEDKSERTDSPVKAGSPEKPAPEKSGKS